MQIPYGIVADNYGRRLVLFLGLLGNLLGSCWTVIVCKLKRIHVLVCFGGYSV